MPLIPEQLGQQRALMPAFARALDAAQHVDVMPEFAGFIFAQLAQLPIVSARLFSAALDDAFLGESVKCVTAEDGGTDAAIQAIQHIAPTAAGN